MPSGTKTKSKETGNPPVHQIRMGRIRAAIWLNETENGPRHNVTVSRLYKDGDEWHDSPSFGRDDLPLVIKVLDQCHTWIYQQGSDRNGENHGRGDNGGNGDAHF